MEVRKNHHRGVIALLFLGITIGLGALFLPSNASAYTAGCQYAANFGSREQLIALAYMLETPGADVVSLLPAAGDAASIGCTDADHQELMAALQSAIDEVREKTAIVIDPNSTPEEKAAAAKSIGAAYTSSGSDGCFWRLFSCLKNWIATTLAFIPAALGAFVLLVAGNLFNFLIDKFW